MKHQITTLLPSLLFLAQLFITSLEAEITVTFGVSEIKVNQKVGAIQIPVDISGNPTHQSSYSPSMAWYSQPGTGVYGVHYYHTVPFFGNLISYETGDPRRKLITISIYFTESITDRTFSVVLDPSQTSYPYNTWDASAGTPAVVNVTVEGVPLEYVLLKQTLEETRKKLKLAGKIRDRKKRARVMRQLRKKIVVTQYRLNKVF